MPTPPKPVRKLEDRFVDNVSRYPFYLISVLLGGIWVGIKPFADLYKRSPLSGILVGLGAVTAFLLLYFTMRGMSGDTFLPDWIMSRLPASYYAPV